ncbi:hypothetical protein OAA08_01015 [bacterium]|nr:hypothetical protein [bacterium]
MIFEIFILVLFISLFLAIKFRKEIKNEYRKYREKRKRQKAANVIHPAAPTAPPAPPIPDPITPSPPKTSEPKPAHTEPEIAPSTRTQERSGHGVPFVLSEVVWPRYLNVSKWRETSVLSGVSISENRTNAKHSKSGEWPPYEENGDSVDSSLWIFVEISGTWYASTFEYLRPNQSRKDLGYKLIPTWTQQRPINTFDLRSGDKVYVMTSGLARRSNVKNVKERSNIVEVTLK